MSEMQEKIDALEAEIRNLNEELAACKNALSSCEKSFGRLRTYIEERSKSLSVSSDEYWKSYSETGDKYFKELYAMAKSKQSLCDSILENMGDLDGVGDDYQSEIKNLKEELAACKNAPSHYEKIWKRLRAYLDEESKTALIDSDKLWDKFTETGDEQFKRLSIKIDAKSSRYLYLLKQMENLEGWGDAYWLETEPIDEEGWQKELEKIRQSEEKGDTE